MVQNKEVKIISFGTENKDDTEVVVEFTAQRGADEIRGYMHVSEADDPDCLHFYDNQGFEVGYYAPKNPYKINSPEWNNYERLAYDFLSDDMLIQLLCDFASENRTIERNNYTLIINEGAMMEAEVVKFDKNPDWAYAQGFEYGLIKFSFNGEPLKLDGDYKLALLNEMNHFNMGKIKKDTYLVPFVLEFWKDNEEYISKEESESILNDYYLEPARNFYAMQLSRDAGIYPNYGENMEQMVESCYNDDISLYRFQRAIELGEVKEFLLAEGFEIED